MRATLISFLLALAVHLMTPQRNFGADPARDSLDGKWEIVGMVYKGKAQKPKGGKLGTMIIEGGTLRRVEPNGAWTEYQITTRPEKEPKEIDFRWEIEKRVRGGIYKFEGDTLTLVYVTKGNEERPKTFDATTDTGLISFTLGKRVDLPKPSVGAVPSTRPLLNDQPAVVKSAPKPSDHVATLKPSGLGDLGPCQVSDVLALLRLGSFVDLRGRAAREAPRPLRNDHPSRRENQSRGENRSRVYGRPDVHDRDMEHQEGP